jgi:hypothetical protein
MAEFVKAERILCKMVGTKNLDRYIQFESRAAQRGEVYSGAASPFGADAAVETAQSSRKSWKDMDYINYHPQTKFRKILVHPRYNLNTNCTALATGWSCNRVCVGRIGSGYFNAALTRH